MVSSCLLTCQRGRRAQPSWPFSTFEQTKPGRSLRKYAPSCVYPKYHSARSETRVSFTCLFLVPWDVWSRISSLTTRLLMASVNLSDILRRSRCAAPDHMLNTRARCVRKPDRSMGERRVKFTVHSVVARARAVRCTQRCVLLSVVCQDTGSRGLLRTLTSRSRE